MSQFQEITAVLRDSKEAVYSFILSQLFEANITPTQDAIPTLIEANRDSIVSEMIRLARLHSVYSEPAIHAAIDCWLDEDAGVCGGLGFLFDET